MELLEAFVLTVITAATPLLLAATGELVTERAGVLNLGVEGMMLAGAVCAFAAAVTTGSPTLGILAAMVAGVTMAAIFSFFALFLVTNQVATGLALTLFGLGVSGMLGASFVGEPGVKLAAIHLPGLSELPLVGRILFGQDPLVYVSFIILLGVSFLLKRSHIGLVVRAVGDNHHSAHALGYNVLMIRVAAVLFGGLCAGLGGAYLSLVYTPQWTEGMTAGRGWIAVALVVFSSWIPGRLLVGAYLFGAVTLLQFHLQAVGVPIPSQFLSALPYAATVIVLVVISRNRRLLRTHTPAMLGSTFVPDK